MKKKVIITVVIIVFIILSFFGGMLFKFSYYKVAFASCRPTSFNKSDYDELVMSEYMNKLIQNFYSSNVVYKNLYAPKNILFKDYLTTFNNGGFHLLETDKGEQMVCGLFK
jgi:hypothetical protein